MSTPKDKANAAFDAAARQVALEISPSNLPPDAHELDEYEDATRRTTADWILGLDVDPAYLPVRRPARVITIDPEGLVDDLDD